MNVIIYSKNNCAFCDKAIALAKLKEVDLTVKKLEIDYSMEEMALLFPTARTFPQIVVNSKNIGGYTEFEALVKQSSK